MAVRSLESKAIPSPGLPLFDESQDLWTHMHITAWTAYINMYINTSIIIHHLVPKEAPTNLLLNLKLKTNKQTAEHQQDLNLYENLETSYFTRLYIHIIHV